MEHNNELLLPYILRKLKEDHALIKDNIHYNDKRLKYRNHYLKLKHIIDNFIKGDVENRFIVMPGLRGVGKSTLMFQLYDYILNEKGFDNDRILYISADQLSNLGENIYNTIEVFINEIHQKSPVTLNKKIFIFIDEAQNDKKWSLTGKILYDQSKRIFMIFTGSSALDLEINIDAVRRTKKETIFPMNFKEYLLLKHGIQLPKGANVLSDMILTGDITKGSKKEKEMINKLSLLKSLTEKEWENYLCYGGFPMSIYLNETEIHEKTYNIIERVIEKDVSHYQSIKEETKNTIFKIIMFLALQKPGELSENKLASSLDVSSASVHNFLNILEKTQLIFNIKPYGGAKKTVRKPWKYYFLSPSIKSSINFILGRYAPKDRKFLGTLAENLVASTFFRMKQISHRPYGIFYPTEKGGVDFLLSRVDGEIIPVEVGIGKKDKKQVKNAMNKYNSEYGVIISNKTHLIKKEEDIIHMPLTTFSFI